MVDGSHPSKEPRGSWRLSLKVVRASISDWEVLLLCAKVMVVVKYATRAMMVRNIAVVVAAITKKKEEKKMVVWL